MFQSSLWICMLINRTQSSTSMHYIYRSYINLNACSIPCIIPNFQGRQVYYEMLSVAGVSLFSLKTFFFICTVISSQ